MSDMSNPNQEGKIFMELHGFWGSIRGYFTPEKAVRIVSFFAGLHSPKCAACGKEHGESDCPELLGIMERHSPNYQDHRSAQGVTVERKGNDGTASND